MCGEFRMKRIFLILVMSLFFISFASASIDNLGTFKQNDCIDLLQTCATCTYNNITSIGLPNGTNNYLEVEMIKTGGDYIYNTCSYSSLTGVYTVNGHGDAGGTDTNWNYKYDINPSGVIQESILNNSVLLILVILSLIFLAIGAFYGIASFGFIGSILLILSGIYTMIYGFNNYTDLYTRGAAVALIGLGFVIMFVSAYEWLPWGEGGE